MCDGGVTICMRSADVNPRASRQCRTAAANAAVGVPHRLGHAGRAGTEHEQRVRIRGGGFERRRPGVTGSSSRSIGIKPASTG